jgi:hypothetical protein
LKKPFAILQKPLESLYRPVKAFRTRLNTFENKLTALENFHQALRLELKCFSRLCARNLHPGAILFVPPSSPSRPRPPVWGKPLKAFRNPLRALGKPFKMLNLEITCWFVKDFSKP